MDVIPPNSRLAVKRIMRLAVGLLFVWGAGGCSDGSGPVGNSDRDKDPAPAGPRFIIAREMDQGGLVQDQQTGLVWVQAPHALAGNDSTMRWADALAYCETLTHGGYKDWRLPSKHEMESLIASQRMSPALPPSHPFEGIIPAYYWTSSPAAEAPGSAWYVHFYGGAISYTRKTHTCFVWPVRGTMQDRAFGVSP